jgi:ribosomal subunit interface protein
MEVSVKEHNIDVGNALRGHIEDYLQAGVGKYFDKALDGSVTISRETNHDFHLEIVVHHLRAMTFQAGASGDDPYGAFDCALGRIAKQLRRYKCQLKDHHKKRRDGSFLSAQQYILQSGHEDGEVPEEGDPTIIVETGMEIGTLSMGEAVMRMGSSACAGSQLPQYHQWALNVVCQRDDGNVGWIDPEQAV